MCRIRDLQFNPASPAVYCRKNGETYMRLHEGYHAKAMPGDQPGIWVYEGYLLPLDPNEEVTPLRG